MENHVKIVGWLWIANGIVSILMFITGLIIVNTNVPGAQDALLITIGGICFFIPGIVADFLIGYGMFNYKSWARVLAIIFAIINLPLFPIGTALGIYTLIIMFNEETKALFSGEVTPASIE